MGRGTYMNLCRLKYDVLATVEDTVRINTIEPMLGVTLFKTKTWSRELLEYLAKTPAPDKVAAFHKQHGNQFNEIFYLRLVSLQSLFLKIHE